MGTYREIAGNLSQTCYYRDAPSGHACTPYPLQYVFSVIQLLMLTARLQHRHIFCTNHHPLCPCMCVILQGYILLSHSFRCLRQVRKDNYSALRASLYQALMSSSQQPDWLQKETFLLVCLSLYGALAAHCWVLPLTCRPIF